MYNGMSSLHVASYKHISASVKCYIQLAALIMAVMYTFLSYS